MTEEMKKDLPHIYVPVMGVTYTVYFGTELDLGMKEDIDGDIDVLMKEIRVKVRYDAEMEDPDARRIYTQRVFLHELSHAFLYESGLIKFYEDETLMQWFEVNVMKLAECFTTFCTDLPACLAMIDSRA